MFLLAHADKEVPINSHGSSLANEKQSIRTLKLNKHDRWLDLGAPGVAIAQSWHNALHSSNNLELVCT